MSFAGVVLHPNRFTACRRTADGAESFETLTLSAADRKRFCLSPDADAELAIEATGNSAWFPESVLGWAGRVVVANPSQRKVIRTSVKKTDRNDIAAPALSPCRDMPPVARARTQDQSELASLTQTRDVLLKRCTRLLNKINALHVRKRLKPKKESIGSKRGLAPCFGIVPRVRQSIETDHRGRITKQGKRLGRIAQTQCTLSAIRYSPYLKGCRNRIRQRRALGKAIICDTLKKRLDVQ